MNLRVKRLALFISLSATYLGRAAFDGLGGITETTKSYLRSIRLVRTWTPNRTISAN
jgi:hypothetical protein